MRREWTKDEEKYLLKYYTLQPIDKTASKLQRSKNSVKAKARKFGLNMYMDNLGAKSIASCFGCDVSVVIRWINKYYLPAKKIKCSNQTRYNIDSEEFWKWAESHKEIINWSKYEIDSLPPEPEWVKEIKSGFTLQKHRKRISIYDKQEIRCLLRKGLTYSEIADRIGRTENSVKHIMRNRTIA